MVVKVTAGLGLRREEICGLRWSSVDFELRKLHIKEARTAAGAEIVQKETKNRSSNRILHMKTFFLFSDGIHLNGRELSGAVSWSFRRA